MVDDSRGTVTTFGAAPHARVVRLERSRLERSRLDRSRLERSRLERLPARYCTPGEPYAVTKHA